MRIDERIREEKNGKGDDYQHDDRHYVHRLPWLFGKHFVRTLDILGSHAYAHIYTQSTAIEVVDDRLCVYALGKDVAPRRGKLVVGAGETTCRGTPSS